VVSGGRALKAMEGEGKHEGAESHTGMGMAVMPWRRSWPLPSRASAVNLQLAHERQGDGHGGVA
jgi:hypothetical protein